MRPKLNSMRAMLLKGSTTMTDNDVASIAAGLSEAQRRAILDASEMMSNHGGYPFFTVEFTEPWTAPVAQFLTLRSDRLTPLGIRVRQFLEISRGK